MDECSNLFVMVIMSVLRQQPHKLGQTLMSIPFGKSYHETSIGGTTARVEDIWQLKGENDE